jgi:hypothetical protein
MAARAIQRTQPPSSDPTKATAQKPQTIMKSPREKATGPVKESASCFSALSQGKFVLVFASAASGKSPARQANTATKTIRTAMFALFLFLFIIVEFLL